MNKENNPNAVTLELKVTQNGMSQKIDIPTALKQLGIDGDASISLVLNKKGMSVEAAFDTDASWRQGIAVTATNKNGTKGDVAKIFIPNADYLPRHPETIYVECYGMNTRSIDQGYVDASNFK